MNNKNIKLDRLIFPFAIIDDPYISTPKPTIAVASASASTSGSTSRKIRESLMDGRDGRDGRDTHSQQFASMHTIDDSRKEQNRILGDIELGLSNLHSTALDINHELHSQSKIIHDIDTKMDTANTKLTVANTGISRLINRGKSGYCFLYIFIGVLLIILAILIYVLMRG